MDGESASNSPTLAGAPAAGPSPPAPLNLFFPSQVVPVPLWVLGLMLAIMFVAGVVASLVALNQVVSSMQAQLCLPPTINATIIEDGQQSVRWENGLIRASNPIKNVGPAILVLN